MGSGLEKGARCWVLAAECRGTAEDSARVFLLLLKMKDEEQRVISVGLLGKGPLAPLHDTSTRLTEPASPSLYKAQPRRPNSISVSMGQSSMWSAISVGFQKGDKDAAGEHEHLDIPL